MSSRVQNFVHGFSKPSNLKIPSRISIMLAIASARYVKFGSLMPNLEPAFNGKRETETGNLL
jgi:hypothetical protein